MPVKKKSVAKTESKKENVVKVEPKKNDDVIKFDFHNKFKKLYFHPKEFFKSVEKENSYQSLLRSFVLFYIFYLIVLQAISLYSGTVTPLQSVMGFIAGIVFSLVIILIFSGVMHFILILTGHKGDYFNSYKAGIYTLILWVFYSIILLIVALIIPFDGQSLQTFLTGAEDFKTIIGASFNFLVSNQLSLLSLIVSIVVHIHIIIFGINALKTFQKTSTGKATFVVITTAILIFALQVALIVLINSSLSAGV